MKCAIELNSAAEELGMAGITAAVLEERVNNHVKFFWAVVAFLSIWLAAGTALLIDIRSDVKVLMLPQKLSQTATNPANPKNQAEAKKILADTKNVKLLPVAIVEQAGSSFLDASPSDQNAWNVALEFASYRTVLNRDLLVVRNAQEIATTPVGSVITHYQVLGVAGFSFPTATSGGDVPFDQSAQMHSLLEPPEDLGQPRGKQVILLDGGALQLDGWVFKRVVFRRINIFYNGGPVQLEDVVFVDCTFTFKNTPGVRELTRAILESAPTKFQPTHN